MNLHRITSHSLPSIKVYDQSNTGDSNSSSTNSHRSMPLDIPIPRHGSPTSSRCGSIHNSMASGGIPPILSLEPPPPPLPPMHHYHRAERRDEELHGDGIRPRKIVLDVRRRDVAKPWTHSPRGSRSSEEDRLSGARDEFSLRSEDSFDRNWREDMYQKRDRDGPKEHHRLQSQDSLRQQIQQSVNAYDHSLVRKLNQTTSDPASFSRSRITPPRDFRPSSGGSENELPPLPAHWQMRNGSPRNLPSSGAASPLEAPQLARWAQADAQPSRQGSQDSNVLPHLSRAVTDLRPSRDSISSAPPLHFNNDSDHASDGDHRLRKSISASHLGLSYEEQQNKRSSHGSYDSYEEDSQMEDIPASHVHKMEHLTINTPPLSNAYPRQYQRVGSKRRASSPPNDDERMAGMLESSRKGLITESVGNDMYASSRRSTPPILSSLRSSPGNHQKYHQQIPRSSAGSFTSASASSATTMWSTSIGAFSVASSITTVDRSSPIASFTPMSDIERGESSLRHISSAHSSRPSTRHIPISELSALRKTSDQPGLLPLGPAPKLTGIFICECCPKKPKKFENASELQLHELEKQYSCLYCNNRFKNKNEAERHQNSLHLRKHSWSCVALQNYEAAFHRSPHRPACADVCGYCGLEFPAQSDWAVRIDHLTTEHKFGECNQSKKFYRADHFRQHLKHSHSGTSGKWTNVLENACMRDELPPTPINRGGLITSDSNMAED